MITYLYLAQIVVAIALITLVMLQAKGSGLGSIFGGDGGVYKTRRGVEKTIYQATIGLSILFFLLAIASVMIGG